MEVASIITAIAALIAAVGSFVNGRKIDKVNTEVKTANSLSLAQLGDATESRRISDIPVKDRTDLEKAHVADVTIEGIEK